MIRQLNQMVADYERGALSRRALLAQLGALVAVGGLGRNALADDDNASSTFNAVGLNHIALNVTNVARSRDFYRKHLGLTVMSEGERNCFLACGKEFVALFQANAPSMDHYCYSIPKYDPDEVVERLKTAGLAPRRRSDRVYFDDPDGLEVQVAATRK